jgi:hypothetical protein
MKSYNFLVKNLLLLLYRQIIFILLISNFNNLIPINASIFPIELIIFIFEKIFYIVFIYSIVNNK